MLTYELISPVSLERIYIPNIPYQISPQAALAVDLDQQSLTFNSIPGGHGWGPVWGGGEVQDGSFELGKEAMGGRLR